MRWSKGFACVRWEGWLCSLPVLEQPYANCRYPFLGPRLVARHCCSSIPPIFISCLLVLLKVHLPPLPSAVLHVHVPFPSYRCLTSQFCALRLLPFSCLLSLSSTLLFPCSLHPPTPFSLLTSVFLPPVTTEILKKAFSAGVCCVSAGVVPLGSPYLVHPTPYCSHAKCS